MSDPLPNRFHDFYEKARYVAGKNNLYNYLLRKRAVGEALRGEGEGPILEVGCGVSPVTGGGKRVYSDLSAAALQILKSDLGRGHFVAADAVYLPFKSRSFPLVVCSEVLEHLSDDGAALSEIARVMEPAGRLVLTFPHRRCYFGRDDRFVGHYRRYELPEMEALLRDAGLKPVTVEKVLGPLEKATMWLAALAISVLPGILSGRRGPSRPGMMAAVRFLFVRLNRLYAALLWLEARLAPRAWATVLLIKAVRHD